MNWIKVSDELPIENTECWVFAGLIQRVGLSTFRDGDFYADDERSYKYKNVIYWRRLVPPLPPEEE